MCDRERKSKDGRRRTGGRMEDRGIDGGRRIEVGFSR
jgi:hypothetical protein